MGINLDVKVDVSESANEIVKKGFGGPIKEAGETLSILIDCFNNLVLWPMKKYNIYKKAELKRYEEQLNKRALEIPKDKLVPPSINVIGPVMEGLKYNLREEHIKEMFMNVLLSDINSDKKEFVLPSYIEIIKQLSNNDAKFLKELNDIYKNNKSTSFYLILIKLNPKDSQGYVELDKILIVNENRVIKLNQLILDNLIRLGIINCKYDSELEKNNFLYEKGYNLIKHNYNNVSPDVGTVKYDNAVLDITEYGFNFLKICLD